MLEACRKAASKPGRLIWVNAEFLAAQKAGELPIWAAYSGETRGFHTWSNARAVRAGLRFRSYESTVRDTLTWYKSQPADGRVKLAGLTPEQEAALLAAWRTRQS